MAQEITGNHRLVDRFIEDGAMLRQGWLEARGGYGDWGGGRDVTVGTLVAFKVLENFEIGGRIAYLDRTRSRDEVLYGERLGATVAENALGDLDLFGKVRFTPSPREFSLGLVVKVPAGDEHERLGSGRTDYELFGATRQTLGKFAWVGNGGVRFNGDSRTPGGGDGRTSFLLGGGALIKLAYSWTFLAEAAFESRRYSGGDPDVRLTPALDFRPTENLSLRLGVGVGLADGSPDREATFGAVFQF